MALDPSIYAAFMKPPKSMAEYDREAVDLENARMGRDQNALQLLLGRAKLDEYQRGVSEANALASLRTSLKGKTDEEAAAGYRAAGRHDLAGELEKGALERQAKRSTIAKEDAERVAKEADTRIKQFQHLAQMFSGIRDQEGYDNAIALAGAAGIDTTKVPRAFNPQVVSTAQNAFLTAAQRLEDERVRRGQDITQRGQDMVDARTRAEGAANRAVTMRGQDLANDRARDANQVTKTEKAAVRKAEADEKAVTKFSDTLQKEGIPDIEAALSGAESIFQRYTDPKTGKLKDVPGIGSLTNVMPDWAVSSEGKDVRESLGAVANIVLAARSGAAVTDQELRRLARELSNSLGSSAADMQRAYAKFRTRFEQVKANAAAGVSDQVLQTYRDRGGVNISRGGAKPAPAPAPAGAPPAGLPSADAIAAELARRAKGGR